HVELTHARHMAGLLPQHVASVCVVVDPDDALLARVEQEFAPNYLQLHGKETVARVAEIRTHYPNVKIIKAFRIRNSDDVAMAHAYAHVADMFLFDARAPEAPGMLPGGNGLAFDWELLKGRQFARPWLLSGGLNAENVADAVRITGASMVDVSSGVERGPGVKDASLIQAFANAVKGL
ncbi:MAG: phosphoribosylanthranilate isomerase, partial [Proteobacteria bacterium]|nr:phosphoribosylanthranilate isomerase [Pseudomonadota bacterium]